MNLLELQLCAFQEEDINLEENEQIAKEIFKKIFYLFPNYIIYKKERTSNLSLMVTLYYNIVKENIEYKRILDVLLEKYNINKRTFILCYLQNLIGQVNPECLGIGVNRIQKQGSIYKVDTDIGNLVVQQASDVFQEEKYKDLWNSTLKQQCFSKTYDFLKINPEYQAVLAYLPNYLSLGYYHAYLENETSIIDIARNLYFPKKKDGQALLYGEILAKLTLKEILKWEQVMHQNISGFTESNYATLGVLSWYLDFSQEELKQCL